MPTPVEIAAELANDPQNLGYAALVAVADDQAVAALLNRVSGQGSGSVFRKDIAPYEIMRAIVAADAANLTALQCAKLQLMMLGNNLDATVTNTRTIFLGIFTGMAGTITALTTVVSRTGSRAEVLWGTGTVITPQQVSGAR